MNYYKIPAEQLEQNLNDVLKMTGDTFSQHDAKLPVVGSLFSQRKIKFRGQTIGGFWVYGNLSLLPKRVKNIEAGSYISNAAGLPFAYNVRPETVTQFTGLKDKNGKEIYEGDIRRVKLSFWSYYFIAPFHPTGHDGYSTIDGICEVVFNNGEFKYKVNKVLPETSAWFDEYKLDKYFSEKLITISCESILIGNVFENPELLQTLR